VHNTLQRRPNIFLRHEMFLLYTSQPGLWQLTRISSSSCEDEIYYEMSLMLEGIIEELDNQYESLNVEIMNMGRRIYIRSTKEEAA